MDYNPSLGRRRFIQILGGCATAIAVSPFLGSCFTDTRNINYGVNYENSLMIHELDKVRPLTEEITSDSPSIEESVRRVVQWSEKNFFHYYLHPREINDPLHLYGEGSEEYLTQNLSIEDVFRERGVSCHLAAFVMITMLRSIGISAEYITELCYNRSGYHGALYVPQIARYVHGDLVADLVGTPANQIIQTKKEFYQMSYPDRGYLTLEDDIAKRYILQLHRLENNLYVSGFFISTTSKEEEEVLSNLSEYNLTFKLHKNGNRGVCSDHIPIVSL